MVTRTISFPDDMYIQMQKIAGDKGISIASVIKLACGEYVKKEAKEENKK